MAKLRALLAASFHVCCLLTTTALAQDQTLQLGTPIQRELGARQSHVFSVKLEENTFIQLVVEQRGIDVIVKVSSPDGKNLGDYDSPNGADGPENVSFVAVTPGTYRITVAPLNQDQAAGKGEYQIKIIELREATEQELKTSKNLEVVKAKGIALLSEVEGLTQEIRSPQTRIRSQLQAAQMLSEVDEKRSAKYLTDAAASLKELLATVDPGSQEYMNDHSGIWQLRHEILQILAARDPDAAISFLQSTKLPGDPYGNRREQEVQENALELSIADQIVAKDPKRAVEIVRQKLKSSYSPNLINTVGSLRHKNPELAAELAGEIAGKLLQEKLLKKPEAAGLTVSLLHACRSQHRTYQSFPRNGEPVVDKPLLSDELCRDLFQKSLEDALSFTPPAHNVYTQEREAAWNLLNGLQQVGPELNNVVNGGLASVEKKLSELAVAVNPYHATIQQVHVKIGNGPVDVALEAIEKAPEEMKEQLYLQLANTAASSGDSTRAKQIINDHISNPYQRRSALANLEQQEMYQAMSRGKVEDALRAISTLRTPRERANMLMQIARQIGPGQKRAAALNLLEQARSMLGPGIQAQDQDQMNALLELIKAFSRYDAKRAFEIVDPLVDQFNEICAAARTLEGFGIEYYKNEELELQNGNNLANLTNQMSGTLGTLAITNFERAKSTSDRLRLPEVRLRAYLEIAQQTIQGAK
jgi:hypothetical protein